ncbi:leukocyte elastase inhibitor-like [Brachyhypopomus gauderio]|uniref:leukocyte elastase inhibitor-like n=1 Tax=Brachyhypopomus gauderio TaxID=698409 RepID=UPI004042A1EF
MDSLSHANSTFALDLYRALNKEKPNGNLFFSPLSISAALSMVYLGARGTTAEEMAKVMSFSSVPDLHAHFKTLNSAINSQRASCILKLANRLYGEKTFNFLAEFLDSTKKFYQADLQTVDFIGATEQSREIINGWVAEHTGDKIKDLLKPGSVDTNTCLALVNAIYFKGNWMQKFDPQNTKEMLFKINKDEKRPVQMMYQNEKFPVNYIPEYRLKVLELPYVQEELSMVVLLPEEAEDSSDPLQKLEDELTVDKLLEWTNRDKMTKSKSISVYLPKFKLDEESSLKATLTKMGMVSLFQENADLKGLSNEKCLSLSKVVHKAFVEVNEEGTEAAAATGVVFETLSWSPVQHFMADHPFLLIIRHNKTNSILFLGKFRCPP